VDSIVVNDEVCLVFVPVGLLIKWFKTDLTSPENLGGPTIVVVCLLFSKKYHLFSKKTFF